MNNSLKRRIAEEIAEYTQRPHLAENEITASQFATIQNITYKQAFDQLEAAVKAGKLSKRWVLHEGHWCWGFSINTDGDDT